MQDIYCQLIPNEDEDVPYYEMMPRIGAFEISHKGVLLYSKMLSQMWPFHKDTVERVAKCLKESKDSGSVDVLKKSFQTSG